MTGWPPDDHGRKDAFPVGSHVRIVRWDLTNSSIDERAIVPLGTEGTVRMVDDFGTVHVLWANGATIGALPEDDIELLTGDA